MKRPRLSETVNRAEEDADKAQTDDIPLVTLYYKLDRFLHQHVHLPDGFLKLNDRSELRDSEHIGYDVGHIGNESQYLLVLLIVYICCRHLLYLVKGAQESTSALSRKCWAAM